MTRDQAMARLAALRNMTEARGCTPNEAATARRLADKLVAKFDIDESEPAPAKPFRRMQQPRPTGVWYGTQNGADWFFDPSSPDNRSGNVSVTSYTNAANWKIEVDLNAQSTARRRRLLDESE